MTVSPPPTDTDRLPGADPREVALVAVRNMAFDWYCPSDERHPRVNCRECIAEVALNAYEAAATQRAAEGAATVFGDGNEVVRWLRLRAALAQPAPEDQP